MALASLRCACSWIVGGRACPGHLGSPPGLRSDTWEGRMIRRLLVGAVLLAMFASLGPLAPAPQSVQASPSRQGAELYFANHVDSSGEVIGEAVDFSKNANDIWAILDTSGYAGARLT